MVNPLVFGTFPYPVIMESAVHELVHAILHNMNSNILKSLDEGIAAYLAGTDEEVNEVLAKVKAKKTVPTLKDLETDAVTFGKIGGYELSLKKKCFGRD